MQVENVMNKKINNTSGRHVHEFPPLYNDKSQILILGSFPSVKSREEGFYYGHPQNRFWKVLAGIYKCNVPKTVNEKKVFLYENNIALWDVIAECDITGSSDSSIKNVIVNDVGIIIKESGLKRIYTNGKKSDALYRKYLKEKIGIDAMCMPSTSPANAAFSLEKLIECWSAGIKKSEK